MAIEINTEHPVTLRALSRWQISGQVDILQEECGEVITSISRFRRGRAKRDKIAEEIADVLVCCMSVIPALGIEGDVKEFMKYKIDRLDRRMNGDQK